MTYPALTHSNQLKKRVSRDQETEFQIRTKTFDVARMAQIAGSVEAVKALYTSKGEIRFAPQKVSPHLKDIREDMKQILSDNNSILFNTVSVKTDRNEIDTATSRDGIVYLSKSLSAPLNLRSHEPPKSHVGDIFMSLSHQPSIVLTVVETYSVEAKTYNVYTAKALTKSLNRFMHDNYAVIFGVITPGDLKATHLFNAQIRKIVKSSSLFVPQESLLMTKIKFDALLHAFWTSIAEAKSIENEKKHFLTAEQCEVLVENLNQKQVLVMCAPHSGATVLMMEVAMRLQKTGPTQLALHVQDDVKRFEKKSAGVIVSSTDSQSLSNLGIQHLVAEENILPISYLNTIPGHIWIFSDHLRPEIMDTLIHYLQTYQFIMVLGYAGEGKTVVGKMLLDYYRSIGTSTITVSTPQDMTSVLDSVDETVVLVDDVFGIYACNFLMTLPIENCLDALKLKGNIKIVFTSRTDVYTDAKDHLGKFKARFQDENKFHLTLNECEKHQMLTQYEERSGTELSETSKSEIMRIKSKHGFPHSCQIFTTLATNMPGIDPVTFFKQPYEVLVDIFNRMLNLNALKFLLYFLVACDGLVHINHLTSGKGKFAHIYKKISKYLEEYSVEELKGAARRMPGCILKESEDTWEFQHPSLYETAFHAVSKKDPQFVLNYGPLSFIQGDAGSGQGSNLSLFTVQVKQNTKEFDDLAKRFADELTVNTVHALCRHELLKNEQFVDCMLKHTDEDSMRTLVTEGNILYWMSSNNDVTLAKGILTQYYDLCKASRSQALLGCCRWGNVCALEHLATMWGQDRTFIDEVSEDGLPCLIVAANQGHEATVKKLIEYGAELTIRDKHTGSNILHWAAAAGHVSIIKFLLKLKCLPVNAQNTGGATPLFLASANGHLQCVKRLCEEKADINLQIQSRFTSLDSRLLPGSASIQRLHGSDRGFTPLHVSCYEGQQEIVKLLLKYGADLQSCSNQGVPAALAARGNNMQTFCLLITDTEKDVEVAISGAFEFGRTDMIEEIFKHRSLGENSFMKRIFQGDLEMLRLH